MRHTAIALLLATVCSLEAGADDAVLFRVSIENVSGHFQARTAREFADLLSRRAGGALKVEFYDGARLSRDADVVAALGKGQAEMAIPGFWQLDRLVPGVAALMLPSAYGRGGEEMRSLVDGPFGASLSREIEAATNCVVAGRWLDLGHAHLFSSARPIRSADDIPGKRIRVAGGRGNEERIRALGARPVSIPAPDLPVYLERGLIDGLLSTYETIDSARLDARGITAVLEDREYYPFYVPLLSRRFWDRLSPALKAAIRQTWEEIVPRARAESAAAQEAAKARLLSRGLRVYQPSAAEAAELRARLLAEEEEIARRLGIPEDGLRRFRESMRAIPP